MYLVKMLTKYSSFEQLIVSHISIFNTNVQFLSEAPNLLNESLQSQNFYSASG